MNTRYFILVLRYSDGNVNKEAEPQSFPARGLLAKSKSNLGPVCNMDELTLHRVIKMIIVVVFKHGVNVRISTLESKR